MLEGLVGTKDAVGDQRNFSSRTSLLSPIGGEQILHVSKAHTESVVEPDRVDDDLGGGNRYPWLLGDLLFIGPFCQSPAQFDSTSRGIPS